MAEQLQGLGGAAMSSSVPPRQGAYDGNESEETRLDSEQALQSDDEQHSNVDEEAVIENADGAILPNDISANSDGIPSTVSSGAAAGSNKKQKREQEEREAQDLEIF
jgi:hypothetical protein